MNNRYCSIHGILAILVTSTLCLSWPAYAQQAKLANNQLSNRPTLQNSEPHQYLLELCGPMTQQTRSKLESQGLRIGRYIPDNTWLVTIKDTPLAQIESIEDVESIRPFKAHMKIAPALANTILSSQSVEYTKKQQGKQSQEKTIQLVVSGFENADTPVIRTALESIPGLSITGISNKSKTPLISVSIPVTEIEQLATIEGVQFIEQAPTGNLRNDTTRWIIQSNLERSTPIWEQGLHGENQVIGLIDTPVNIHHCSFEDSVEPGPTHRKFVAYRGTEGSHAHGTHVAGTLAGDQSPYDFYDTDDGMAYSAKISFSDYMDVAADPETLYDRFQDAHDDGARIHSNSWGDDSTTEYTTWSRQADEFAYDNEMDLVVFAVTNFTTLKSPENAKNPLAVGASRTAPYQDYHSNGGYGPTTDGRRKPEIYAPGQSIHSSWNLTACDWTYKSGTSMAAPAIAGMAALTRQYFMEGFYPTGQAIAENSLEPSGALLKATLINAAVDMLNVTHLGDNYPNDKEGWGRILLDNTLFFKGESARLIVKDTLNADGLQTGESTTVAIRVFSNAEPLKITLAWTDPPPALQAEDVVVNNLDLSMETTGVAATTYYGNVFDTIAGESIPGGTPDSLNNVERIILDLPEPGRYSISISAPAVNDGPQGYALVLNGDINECQWNDTLGDADQDGDIDLADFAGFQECFGKGSENNAITPECFPFDFNCDDMIDQEDATEFIEAITGPLDTP